MKSKGKYGLLWEKARNEWIRQNPPNHEGYYTCWLCGSWVKAEEMELDHIKSRTRASHLRFVQSNLAPSHHICNQEKGSTEIVNPPEAEKDVHSSLDDTFWY